MIPSCSIVIPYRSSGDAYRDVIHKWHIERLSILFPSFELIVSDSNHNIFNRSAARNVGIRSSTNRYVAVVDSDTIFNESTLINGLQMIHKNKAPWVVGHDLYLRTDKASAEKILLSRNDCYLNKDNYSYEYEFDYPPSKYEEAVSGLVIFRKSDILDIGGYDERFIGWGFEDRALLVVADRKLGKHQRPSNSVVWHLWHEEPPGPERERPYYEQNRKLYEEILG